MGTIAGLLAHAISFAGFVTILPTLSVSLAAWLVLYAVGVIVVLLGPRLTLVAYTARGWSLALFYAVLSAVIFAGADLALQALGNAVKPRAIVPPALGGLEFYFLLVPGVASVALGQLARFAALHFLRPSTSAPSLASRLKVRQRVASGPPGAQ